MIAQRMTAEGHQVVSLHGAKDATERDQTIDDFREGKSKVLITTNVIARGIDILQVNMVVNYDLPMTMDNKPDVETYLHRIGKSYDLFRRATFFFSLGNRLKMRACCLPGRTGRFGRRGASINFVHDKRTWDDMMAIQKALNKPIQRVETDDLDEMETVCY